MESSDSEDENNDVAKSMIKSKFGSLLDLLDQEESENEIELKKEVEEFKKKQADEARNYRQLQMPQIGGGRIN